MTEATLWQVPASEIGLTDGELAVFNKLMRVWQEHLTGNLRNEAYYLQKVSPKVSDKARPDELKRMKFVIGWPTKAVDVLVNRSCFEGFTSENGAAEGIADIVDANRMGELYRQAATSQLISSCSFITLSGGFAGEPAAIVSAQPAKSAAALWDHRRRRIKAGVSIIDVEDKDGVLEPTWVNLYLDEYTVRCRRMTSGAWSVDRAPHAMGRPLMEPLCYRPSLERPFGRTRISAAVRSCTDRALQTVFRMDASACFYTWPQRVLAGIDKKDLERIVKQKAEMYVDRLMLITSNRNGDTPNYFQLPQMSMDPHVKHLETVAKQFCGEAGIPLNELGIVFDNPSSAEAIREAQGALIAEAEYLNDANGAAMRNVGLMLLAQARGVPLDRLSKDDKTLRAQFADPEHPSKAQRADYAMKVASVVPGFSSTSFFWRELGYSPEEVAGVTEEIRRAQAMQVMAAIAPGAAGQPLVV